ncbi:MAG: Type secretion system protein virB9 precursor, partial [Pseudomonadota bacterium]
MKKIISIYIIFVILFATSVANLNATSVVPVDSRIKTLIYSPNEIFQVKFMLGYQSIIELAENENIELISFGDSIPWSIRTVGRRIFLKALDPGVKTNMTIITNKRTYLLEISSTESTEEIDDRIAYILRFFYPEINVDISNAVNKQKKIAINPNAVNVTKLANQNGVSSRFTLNSEKEKKRIAAAENLNLMYTYAGNATELMPEKVFDNGLQTYFQFANSNAIVPIISIVDENGVEKQVKFRIINNYIVVNTTAQQFSLRRNESLLCIFNEKDSNK